jgi:hypothetical protein
MRCAQAKEYERQGRKVPSGFITPQWFFTFQYNSNLLLAAAPLKVHDIEQWALMFARWTIADASDMCKDSEFSQILAKADAISVQIQEFLRAMTGSGGPTIPHALKSDIVQLILRFSAVRSRWVAQIVEHRVAEARLRDLHSRWGVCMHTTTIRSTRSWTAPGSSSSRRVPNTRTCRPTVDDIVGPAPVPNRRPIPRPGWERGR